MRIRPTRKFWRISSAIGALLILVWWGGTQAVGRSVVGHLRRLLPGVTSVGRITLTFPPGIALQHVRWQDAITAEPILRAHRIVLQPSWGALLMGRLFLTSLTIRGAELHVVRNPDKRWNVMLNPQSSSWARLQDAILRHFLREGRLGAQRVRLLNGVIVIEDQAVRPPVTLRMEHVTLRVWASPLPPRLWRTRFSIEGILRAQPEGPPSPFRLVGWLDPLARDLEATFHIGEVELKPLHPYYQGKVTSVHAYAGRLTLQGEAKAKQNELTATCHLTLSNLTQGDISILGRTIVDVGNSLQGTQGTLASEILVRGPLDQPAQWRYELGPNQAPLILLFLPLMELSGQATVIKIGPTELDVGSAVQQWLGSSAPVPQPGAVNGRPQEATSSPPPPPVAGVLPTTPSESKETTPQPPPPAAPVESQGEATPALPAQPLPSPTPASEAPVTP